MRVGSEKSGVSSPSMRTRRDAIKLHEKDGDWHVEITEEEYTPVPASCIIVEIPAPERRRLPSRA